MFREIRKKANAIDEKAIKELLKNQRRGIFAVNGDDGYPYAIPVNYLYDEESNKICFHGARAGHKVDAVKACDKVCFTVYGNETVKDDEEWAPYLQSVVAFGRCRLVEDKEESLEMLKKFAMKYYPTEEMVLEEMADSGAAAQMFEIEIEHMSGKQIQEK